MKASTLKETYRRQSAPPSGTPMHSSSAFTFHPEFAQNGPFFTIHAEHDPGNMAKPDFIPPGYGLKDVTYHSIVPSGARQIRSPTCLPAPDASFCARPTWSRT
jgi:hypothetical protein